VLLVFVLAFGWASYHYIYVEKVFETKEQAVVPSDQLERVKRTVDEGLGNEEAYSAITAFNWRPQTKRYRVDVLLVEGSTVGDAKRMASRVNELVMRASDGSPAEVSFAVLGREIYHFVP
jgi:hypothetical protein